MRLLLILIALPFMNLSYGQSARDHEVRFLEHPDQNKVEVLFDGALFTAYIYPKNIMKPVLWPVITSKGMAVTRSYPLQKIAGERTDHPHHIGIWFNYGDVNGIDYWNNSEAIPASKKNKYGEIHHQEVISMNTAANQGELVVVSQWMDNGRAVLDEKTHYTFINRGDVRIIDRKATLTALEDVLFEDNKEGMLGIRMASELEMPSDDAVTLTDAHGNPTTVKGKNNRASGDYLSSEGIHGGEVWGTRARWMDLCGKLGGEKVNVVIIDHPENPGYPTYWHARGYGLFAANPLGQKAMSEGKEALHFKLNKDQQATFRYRIVISDDKTGDKNTWNKLSDEFAKIKN